MELGCDREDHDSPRHWMHRCWTQDHLIGLPFNHNIHCYSRLNMWMLDISCDLCAVNMLLHSKVRLLFIFDSRLRQTSIMEAHACLRFEPLCSSLNFNSFTLTDLQLTLNSEDWSHQPAHTPAPLQHIHPRKPQNILRWPPRTCNPFTAQTRVKQLPLPPSLFFLSYPHTHILHTVTGVRTHIWPGGKLSPNIPTEANLHPFRGR